MLGPLRLPFALPFAFVFSTMMALVPLQARANLVLQQQTNVSCAACHQPAKEQLGREGLSEFGTLYQFCGYKIRDCVNPRNGRPIAELLSAADQARMPSMAGSVPPSPSVGAPTNPAPQFMAPAAPAPAAPGPSVMPPQPIRPIINSSLPPGSYLSMCQNTRTLFNGTVLAATCPNGSGANFNTVVRNVDQCGGPVFVNRGYLQCQYRNGTPSPFFRYLEVRNELGSRDLLGLETAPLGSNNFKAVQMNPVAPEGSMFLYFRPEEPCNQSLRVRLHHGFDLEEMDTCGSRRLRYRSRGHSIEE